MIHTVALDEASCPAMIGNTYIQTLGGTIGRYGGNRISEPNDLIFDENAEKAIKEILGDKDSKVYFC